MESIVAAALIAVGIVLAAVIYGRMHGARTAPGGDPDRSAPVVEVVSPDPVRHDADMLERTAAVTRREEALARAGGGAREGASRARRRRDRRSSARSSRSRACRPAARSSCCSRRSRSRPSTTRARRIRQIEEETKREAERRVRNILSVCMQRLAAGHAAETTVSVVQLSADDMKGRIIGREGRNIRALENLTGVDFIIDDTPGAVVLSGFDGVRREIARLTLEKLLQDGRIHPARIEEMYYQAKSELESHIVELGEQAVFEAGVQGLHPELVKLLGPPQVPHQLRPERPGPLDRGLASGRDDGRRSSAPAPRPPGAPRCCMTSARRSPTRWKGPTRSSEGSSRASTASPRRSRTRWRRTTTRSSRRRSRR